jgi:DNA-binding NarL/FixJ family response regulator
MRVALVGRPSVRARLRAELAGTPLEIAGEFETMEELRSAAIPVDAVMMSPDARAAPPPRRRDEGDAGVEHLTSREIQVLELLAEGLPNRSIAARLGISDQTVKFHVASVLGKLGAANRTEAVRRAVRRGVLSL